MPRGVYDRTKSKRRTTGRRRKFQTATDTPTTVKHQKIKTDLLEQTYNALATSGMILITDADEYRRGGDNDRAASADIMGRRNLALARKLLDL